MGTVPLRAWVRQTGPRSHLTWKVQLVDTDSIAP